MKNRVLLITLICFFFIIPKVKASHFYGGSITWRCLSNGKYIFFMTVYRDCTGASWTYQNESLHIYGNPLPRGARSHNVSSIIIKPDSNKWKTNRNGDTSPQCNPGTTTDNLSCKNGDMGTVQAFYYKSDPFTLSGVPPIDGWRIVYLPPCCRATFLNLASSGTPLLQSIMYRDKHGSNVNPCIDSSPEFKSAALPPNIICRDRLFTYNYNVFDADLDSVVFAWDKPLSSPANNPVKATYAKGFAFNNPTPDNRFDSRNIPATLDSQSGMVKLAVYSGGPQPKKYLTVVRADAYRYSEVIASVFYEIPYVFFDCEPLPKGPNGLGGGQNNSPTTFIYGQQRLDTIVDVVAGRTVHIPFQATDYDYAGSRNNGQQKVTTIPNGFMFSTDLVSKGTCYTNSIAPCAILKNQSPTLNMLSSPPRREISGNTGINTVLEWETRCYHVRTAGTGVPGKQYSSYNFVMRTMDDNCPIPAMVYPTITVRIRDPFPLSEPIMIGASVGLDGRLIYQWVPPIDSAFSFNRYKVEFSTVNNNQPPSLFQTLNANLKKYESSFRNGAFPFYYNSPNNKPNILNALPGKDWYFRMTTESGCYGNVASGFSAPVKVIELNLSPVGKTNPRSQIKLDWNRPKPLNAATKPYFIYQSPTHFYVWENDSIDLNGQYIGGEADSANWYLRAHTMDTTHTVASNVCNSEVGYRIEARDTIITYKQGAGFNLDSIDTLTFRTYSIIDTILTQFSSIAVEDQHLDYLFTSNTTAKSYQWYNCNTNKAIAGATQRKYIPLDTGHFAVEVKLKDCSAKSPCFYVSNLLDTTVSLINDYTLESNAKDVKYQWIDCRADTSIPQATNARFQAKDTGYYAVIVRAYGYADTSDCYLLKTLSLPEISFADQMTYYPNPTNHNLTIKLEKEVGELKVKVRNLQGQLMQQLDYHQTSKVTLELKGKAGLYFVEVSNGRGEKANLKVIKQQ